MSEAKAAVTILVPADNVAAIRVRLEELAANGELAAVLGVTPQPAASAAPAAPSQQTAQPLKGPRPFHQRRPSDADDKGV